MLYPRTVQTSNPSSKSDFETQNERPCCSPNQEHAAIAIFAVHSINHSAAHLDHDVATTKEKK
jgi:hypothetical protein